jgi:hypothetical protein
VCYVRALLRERLRGDAISFTLVSAASQSGLTLKQALHILHSFHTWKMSCADSIFRFLRACKSRSLSSLFISQARLQSTRQQPVGRFRNNASVASMERQCELASKDNCYLTAYGPDAYDLTYFVHDGTVLCVRNTQQ